ncbi:TPA: helix-turn-helix transcriptional regulator [Burkholderia cenocepacia]
MTNAADTKVKDEPAIPSLPVIGLSKWAQIAPFLHVGRETWRKMVRDGKAPQPIRFSKTCLVYRNEEILRYLADPLNYRA